MDALEQQRQDYARQLRTRFDDYKRWAIEHWPVAEQPLEDSAFIAAERELELITGSMLHPGRSSQSAPAEGRAQAQYQDVTPAPWP